MINEGDIVKHVSNSSLGSGIVKEVRSRRIHNEGVKKFCVVSWSNAPVHSSDDVTVLDFHDTSELVLCK